VLPELAPQPPPPPQVIAGTPSSLRIEDNVDVADHMTRLLHFVPTYLVSVVKYGYGYAAVTGGSGIFNPTSRGFHAYMGALEGKKQSFESRFNRGYRWAVILYCYYTATILLLYCYSTATIDTASLGCTPHLRFLIHRVIISH
jgi:hypothetical protein